MDSVFTLSLFDALPFAAVAMLCLQIGAILVWFPTIIEEIRKNRRPRRHEIADGL
jgi:hypothetical protein